MRRFIAFAAAVMLLGATSLQADQYVRGYIRSDGRYVAGYYRSTPDRYTYNNYSTYPNYNPYTGAVGTRRYDTYPYRSLPPVYQPMPSVTPLPRMAAPSLPALPSLPTLPRLNPYQYER